MRITAGRLKGRILAAPEGMDLRPTSDKVRQAIFNVLEHHNFGNSFSIEGARVIDLFAGTGALGIEALSRGARYALLIDNAAKNRAYLRRNIEAMNLTGVTKIWRRDGTDLGRHNGAPFDLAFLDPPYRKGLVAPALTALCSGGWLRSQAIVVVETAADEIIPSTDEFERLNERTYGETKIGFLRFDAQAG